MITSPLPGAKLWRGISTLPRRCPLLMASPIKRRSVDELGLIRGAFDSSNPVTLGLLVAGRRRRLLAGEADDDVAALVAVVDVAVRLNDVGEVVGSQTAR